MINKRAHPNKSVLIGKKVTKKINVFGGGDVSKRFRSLMLEGRSNLKIAPKLPPIDKHSY